MQWAHLGLLRGRRPLCSLPRSSSSGVHSPCCSCCLGGTSSPKALRSLSGNTACHQDQLPTTPPHLASPPHKGFLCPGGKPLQLSQNLCHRGPRRVMWSWARSCFGHHGSRSSISSGANTTQENAAESQPRVGWEQITISLPRKTNWTCQEERNSSTSHTYGLILMDMYEHKGRRITFWLG